MAERLLFGELLKEKGTPKGLLKDWVPCLGEDMKKCSIMRKKYGQPLPINREWKASGKTGVDVFIAERRRVEVAKQHHGTRGLELFVKATRHDPRTQLLLSLL